MRNQSATGVLREPESLLSGGDADVSTTREDSASAWIREACGLERHRERWPGQACWGNGGA